ncbi:MAG: class I SAM-dependent methyltransferase [Acidobacteriota bacterium]|nr:MAG: class I SAM-dependent methyltransferase [Acidobacteriota bacterium]
MTKLRETALEGEYSRDVTDAGSTSLARALVRRRIFDLLNQLEGGILRLVIDGDVKVFGRLDASDGLEATIFVHDERFFTAIAFRGSMGAGESYMDAYWTTDNLTALIQIIARNRRLMSSVDSGLARLVSPLYRLAHRLRRNSNRGSRRNIAEHYDLGNEFFSVFLDETMMYSAGFFESESSSLRQASVAKVERICQKLKLNPADHLIEIGTGWGYFAIHAARHYGCRVTTTTVSEEQYRWAVRRVKDAGLESRIEVLLQDYRDLRGSYDKLVSIEMIEAVGHEFLGVYFRKCSELLRPNGLGLIQAITMAEEFYERSRQSVDFIQRYIFPGSDIPSLSSLKDWIGRSEGLSLLGEEDLTAHYAETLKLWRERFLAGTSEIRSQGFPDRFLRMWDFYFSYCEGGFRERHIGDYQLLLSKATDGRRDGSQG